jgi:hypothetical protein
MVLKLPDPPKKTGGVKPKFIMFDGQMLLDDVKIIRSPGSNGIADCTYPSVAVFLSAVGERKYNLTILKLIINLHFFL